MWRENLSRAVAPGQKITLAALPWALAGLVCQQLYLARVAEGLGVSWNTANDAMRTEGQRLLIRDPYALTGLRSWASMSMSGGTSRPETKNKFTGFKTAVAEELPEAVEKVLQRVQPD